MGLPTFGSTGYPELSDTRLSEIVAMLPMKPAGFGVPCSNRAAWGPVAEHYQVSIEKAEEFLARPPARMRRYRIPSLLSRRRSQGWGVHARPALGTAWLWINSDRALTFR